MSPRPEDMDKLYHRMLWSGVDSDWSKSKD